MDYSYLILQFLIMFLSYSVGRMSHIYAGHWNTPHHWIYGYILIAIGAFMYDSELGLTMISVGIGQFISDLKDFTEAKFFGPDIHDEKRFWGFD